MLLHFNLCLKNNKNPSEVYIHNLNGNYDVVTICFVYQLFKEHLLQFSYNKLKDTYRIREQL